MRIRSIKDKGIWNDEACRNDVVHLASNCLNDPLNARTSSCPIPATHMLISSDDWQRTAGTIEGPPSLDILTISDRVAG